MQVRFYFLHNYKLATGSRHSNFFSFKLQQIISFSCLTNDIRHVHSIKNSISPIDDRVLIEHCSFDVVLSLSLQILENRVVQNTFTNTSFGPRRACDRYNQRARILLVIPERIFNASIRKKKQSIFLRNCKKKKKKTKTKKLTLLVSSICFSAFFDFLVSYLVERKN